MKIFAFTDIHEDMQLLARIKRVIEKEKVDLAVCTGDFTVFSNGTKMMMEAMDKLGVPLVLIPGNHEDEDEIETLLPRFKNIHYAHERVVDVKGLRFIGFGGRGFRRHEPDLEVLERKHAKDFDGRTIFLCHAPPYGTALDEVDEGWHVGNETLTELIRRRKPMLVLCGHIHECFHAHDEVAGTPVINPGPDGEIIEVEE
jgi:Icc-related predicted phosphoesterase